MVVIIWGKYAEGHEIQNRKQNVMVVIKLTLIKRQQTKNREKANLHSVI